MERALTPSEAKIEDSYRVAYTATALTADEKRVLNAAAALVDMEPDCDMPKDRRPK